MKVSSTREQEEETRNEKQTIHFGISPHSEHVDRRWLQADYGPADPRAPHPHAGAADTHTDTAYAQATYAHIDTAYAHIGTAHADAEATYANASAAHPHADTA